MYIPQQTDAAVLAYATQSLKQNIVLYNREYILPIFDATLAKIIKDHTTSQYNSVINFIILPRRCSVNLSAVLDVFVYHYSDSVSTQLYKLYDKALASVGKEYLGFAIVVKGNLSVAPVVPFLF